MPNVVAGIMVTSINGVRKDNDGNKTSGETECELEGTGRSLE